MDTTIRLLVALGFAAASLVAQAKDLPGAKPEAVGMSGERLARIKATLAADVEARKIPGAVVLVARHGKVVLYDAVGKVDPAGGAPMTKDAIFRIYSMSKPITTLTAMMLVEEGKLMLTDPVSKYIPSFAKMQVGVEKPDATGKPVLELVPARRQITIQDLMRHTSGITYGFFGSGLVKAAYTEANLGDSSRSNLEVADRVAALPLAYQPGSTWDYSHSTDVLGRVIEVVTGKSLYQAEKERLLDPLGLVDTSFYVTDAAKHKRVAEPFGDDRNIGVNAIFGDPRVAARYESGGGGMMSTAMEYARFLQMLLNGGTLDGVRVLGPRTVALMTRGHVDSLYATPGSGFGLGFQLLQEPGRTAQFGSAGTFSWGGAYGSTYWVDPADDLVAVLLIQEVPRGDLDLADRFRALVYQAIVADGSRRGGPP